MGDFKITDTIEKLKLEKIKENLLCYSYESRSLLKLIKKNAPKDSEAYLTRYSSLKGEVYENLIYEHLINYAYKNRDIVKFILKGPYQNRENQYIKSGLLIDKSSQIVYKSAYKDISEFDALFFTKDSLYFVEISTSKKTASLNKRLLKKYALLTVLFPSYKIKALIVLTKGSVGLRSFPSYATIWLTDDLENDRFLKEIIHLKNNNKSLKAPNSKKFVETYSVKYKKFQYFPILKWILETSRSHKYFNVDLRFFSSKKLAYYFDIFTKLYIGYMKTEDFKKIYKEFDMNVLDDMIIVTLEKINQTTFDIVYYVKQVDKKLYRLRLEEDNISIKQKEPDGFTTAEVRFFYNVLNEQYILYPKDIAHIKKNIFLLK